MVKHTDKDYFPIVPSRGFVLIEPTETKTVGSFVTADKKDTVTIKRGTVIAVGATLPFIATETYPTPPCQTGDIVHFRQAYGNDPFTFNSKKYVYVEHKDVTGVIYE